MRDDHDRFRSRVAEYLAEVLSEADAAWVEQHVATCASCADLLKRVQLRLPELAHDAGHIPFALLERWALEPGSMTPLEREIVQRHVAGCEICRGDAEELIAAAGVPGRVPVAAPRTIASRGWLAFGAAAAVLVTAIVLRSAFVSKTPVSEGAGGTGSPPPARGSVPVVTLTFAERERSAAPESARVRAVIGATDSLELRLPPLFIADGDTVAARILGADGGLVWGHYLSASALGATLAPPRPAAGWLPGRYRLVIVPRAGRDTAAAREFMFQLDPRRE